MSTESIIPSKGFTPTGFEFIKVEPGGFSEDETNSKDGLCLDEKYHIKNERVEIDESLSVVDRGLQEEFSLGNVKFENNSDSDPNTTTEKLNVATGEKSFVASRKTFKCTLCSYIAKKPSRLKNHFNEVHSEIRSFRCSYCEYAGKSKRTLKTHMLNKHEHKSGTVRTKPICHECKKEFSTKQGLEIHMNSIHLNIKIKCTDCDFKAKSKYALNTHITLVHHPENLYKCHDCGYATPSKGSLTRHILVKHLKQFCYTCDICGHFKTNSNSSLRLHKNIHKVPPKLYKCPYCPFMSKYKAGLGTHIGEEHVKKSLFTCEICEYQTKFLSSLNNHINVNHNKIDFVCPECGIYTSKYERSIMTHMFKVHGIKEIGNEMLVIPRKASYKCSLCPFTTTSSSLLTAHLNSVHTDVCNYNCPYCDFATKLDCNLKKHILNKHEDKTGNVRTRYICYICEKDFQEKRGLKVHVLSKHLNIEESKD